MNFLKNIFRTKTKEEYFKKISYECFVCAKIYELEVLRDPNWRLCGSQALSIYQGPFQMTRIDYGEINKRFAYICREHKDAEIKEKLLEVL